MFRRGIEVETEVLEFRYMEMTEELAKSSKTVTAESLN